MFIVNKSNFIYFTCFVYTSVTYKYNVLLKGDNVCLILLSTLVTLSRFDEGKEIKIVCSNMAYKSNAKCCGDIAATLWQRLDNVGELRCHNVGNRRRHNSTMSQNCNNVTNDVETRLLQRRCASWDDASVKLKYLKSYDYIFNPLFFIIILEGIHFESSLYRNWGRYISFFRFLCFILT